jgi:NAD(P)-dependent dehydrogenase (short-subunit alcohol dehydrogenase family)
MKISKSVALVTGANRGIGRSLVAALLDAGASRVYPNMTAFLERLSGT